MEGDEVTTEEPSPRPFVLMYIVADPVTGLNATAVRHVNVRSATFTSCRQEGAWDSCVGPRTIKHGLVPSPQTAG